jgi:hypothetical protein
MVRKGNIGAVAEKPPPLAHHRKAGRRLGNMQNDCAVRAKGIAVNNKLSRLVLGFVVCGWCLLPVLARGDQAAAAKAATLGTLESVLHYCGSVDSSAAAQLREKIQSLTEGLSEQQVAELRQSSDYQAAYSSIESFVGKVDEHNARRVCTESVSETKTN